MSDTPEMDAALAGERAVFERLMRSDSSSLRAIGKLKLATTYAFRHALLELITEKTPGEDIGLAVVEAVGWMIGCAAVMLGRERNNADGLACFLASKVHENAHREVEWAFAGDGHTHMIAVATTITDDGAFVMRDATVAEEAGHG